jgi:hypothetical protein
MKIRGFLNRYKTKWRIERKDRQWERSARKCEIDEERDLPPRPLTHEEHELLCWILENGSDEAKSFLPQVEGVRAVRACTCGCPTIQLRVVDGVPMGTSSMGRVIGDLYGKTAKDEIVGVLLFQDAGKLSELEVYSLDGIIHGDLPEFGLPTTDSLSAYVEAPLPGHKPSKSE